MKWFKRVSIVVLVLLVVVVLAVFLLVDGLVVKGVETAGTQAMGVETTLAGAEIGIFAGEATLTGLRVANPEGFQTEHFLALGEGAAAVQLRSLFADKVVVPLIALRNIDLNIEEQGGTSNANVILENIKKLGDEKEPGEEEPAPPEDEEAEGKRFEIEKLNITDVIVHATWAGQTIDIRIGEIPLSNIGSETGSGVLLSQLSGIIVEAILQAVVEKAGGELPAALGAELQRGLAALGDLGDFTTGVVEDVTTDVTKALEKATEDAAAELEKAAQEGSEAVSESLDEATRTIGEGVEKAKGELEKGLDGILRGAKKEPENEKE